MIFISDQKAMLHLGSAAGRQGCLLQRRRCGLRCRAGRHAICCRCDHRCLGACAGVRVRSRDHLAHICMGARLRSPCIDASVTCLIRALMGEIVLRHAGEQLSPARSSSP